MGPIENEDKYNTKTDTGIQKEWDEGILNTGRKNGEYRYN
jgi:hypothetical protein